MPDSSVHARLLAEFTEHGVRPLTLREKAALRKEYAVTAPGAGADGSAIDFTYRPRTTTFSSIIRTWMAAHQVLEETGALTGPAQVKMLDVGAGRCEILWALRAMRRAKGARIDYTAIDIDLNNAVYFETHFGTAEGRRFLVHDLRQPLPYADASIDAIASMEVIEHVERDEALALLAEKQRVLRPGGVLVMSTPNHRGSVICDYHQYEWTAEELRSAIDAQGGWDVRHWYYHHVRMDKISDLLPEGYGGRVHPEWLRHVLGPASGRVGSKIHTVLVKQGERISA